VRNRTACAICAVLALASACGGGGSSSGGGPPPPTGQNVAPIIVDSGPAAAVNIVNTAYVTVTLCAPGGTTCQTIDHVSVDTASFGFRVIASVLNSSLAQALPQTQASSGQPLVECTQFADGYVWGPVKTADLKIGGEEAASVPIQVIGDSAFPTSTVPTDCSSLGKTNENTVAAFGANGILGIGVFREDCGPGCATGMPAGTPLPGWYYSCPSSGCTGTLTPVAQQVQNPVFHFTTDNNGVIVELQSVGAAGAPTASGSLVFGIDTQSNNALGMATVLTVDANVGEFTTQFNTQTANQTLAASIIDSGSNGLFFPDSDSTMIACKDSTGNPTGFYCPASVQSLSATMQSVTGITKNVSFSIASADSLLSSNPNYFAFSNLGGPSGPTFANSFDWGLPFFYGRNVFVAIEGQTTSAGMGPYVAF